MQRINITDFSGGKNTFEDQLLVKDNQCVATSQNVWAPRKALTKMGGCTVFSSFTATSSASTVDLVVFEPNISTAYTLYYSVGISSGGTTNYLFASNGQTDSLTPLGYVTGTVSVSGANLISATGNGTLWSSHVSAGDRFRIDATASAWYRISSVEDNTHLTLGTAIPVAVATGSAYTAQLGIDALEVGHASLNGSFLIGTISNVLQRFDTTGMTRITSAPQAAFWVVFKNYLHCFRTNTAESRWYWSAVADPTSWPANSSADVDKAKGKITGAIAYGNELIVFKQRSMYKIVGDTFSSTNPTYGIYPIAVPNYFLFNSNYSAAINNGILMFASKGTVYAYRHGTMMIQRISKIYQDDITDTRTDSNLMGGFDQRVCGASFNDYYIVKGLYGPSGNLSDAGIVDENGAWWLIRNSADAQNLSPFGGTRMTVYVSTTTSIPQLLTHTEAAPRIINWDLFGPTYQTQYITASATGAFSNSAINSTWISKEFNIEYGSFKKIVIYFAKQTAGNLTVEWSIDQAAFVSTTVNMTTGRGSVIRYTLNVNQKGSTIQLRLSNTTVGQTFKIYGINIYYEPVLEGRVI